METTAAVKEDCVVLKSLRAAGRHGGDAAIQDCATGSHANALIGLPGVSA